ncbi:hypothetical protein HYS00_00755, partial [Candidatus Microgenomates bacterium]|nr:hypothetical protein [Candidatus Microgenomates bacterium]
LVAEDGGALSSTRIRLGEIDSQGNVHERHFKKVLHLPESLREAFKKAPGQVVRGAQDDLTRAAHDTLPLLKDAVLTIAVGDIVSDSLQKVGFTPTIKIIDHKNQRKPLAAADPMYDAKNAPGTINPAGVTLLNALIRDALAPLGSIVLHGQAGEGIAVTPVAEETKREILHLIRQFTS